MTVEERAVEQHGLFNERHDVRDDQRPAEIPSVLHRKGVHEDCAGIAYRLQALRASPVAT
jgi:hypothetical protein